MNIIKYLNKQDAMNKIIDEISECEINSIKNIQINVGTEMLKVILKLGSWNYDEIKKWKINQINCSFMGIPIFWNDSIKADEISIKGDNYYKSIDIYSIIKQNMRFKIKTKG